MERDFEILRREMRGERERQSQFRGEPRAEIARAEKIERHLEAGAGNRLDSVGRAGEIRLQLENVLRKRVAATSEIAA